MLTTGVGAVGLTLTGADRVIMLDPSWNPGESCDGGAVALMAAASSQCIAVHDDAAVDAQAVDRAYRIGQKRDVVTYRLVTCGTVEEAVYRRQVFKVGHSRCRSHTPSLCIQLLRKAKTPTGALLQLLLRAFGNIRLGALFHGITVTACQCHFW